MFGELNQVDRLKFAGCRMLSLLISSDYSKLLERKGFTVIVDRPVLYHLMGIMPVKPDRPGID